MTEDSATEDSAKHCKFCLNRIRKAANVCYRCGRDQRWIYRNFSNIPVLVSVGLLIFSIVQTLNATAAVKKAQEAETKVLNTATELRHVVKLVVENSFITAQSGPGLVMGADRDAKKRLESNLSQLSKFAQPDSIEEERWWAEIHKLYPQYQGEKK